MASKIPNTSTTFKDTFGRGKILIRGWTLEADEDGFIECPPDFASELAAHGFLPQARPVKQAQFQGKH